MLETMRPGIYTSYTVSAYGAGEGERGLGIVSASQIPQLSVQKITSQGQAQELFGPLDGAAPMTRMIIAALQNGVGKLYAVSPATEDESGYEAALNQLLEVPEVYAVCTDREDQELETFLKTKLDAMEAEGRERIAVLGSSDWEQAEQKAVRMNHKRICVAYPAAASSQGAGNLSPVLLGSMICREHRPYSNLNGELAEGDFILSQQLSREQQEQLMQVGICLLEPASDAVMLVRGMTTHTKNESGLNDRTYRNISSVLILDQVVPGLRQVLQQLLTSSDNSTASLDGIQSMTASRLEDFKQQGLISDYGVPNVYLKEDDRTVCVVEVNFTVRQGLNQIYLTAQIHV